VSLPAATWITAAAILLGTLGIWRLLPRDLPSRRRVAAVVVAAAWAAWLSTFPRLGHWLFDAAVPLLCTGAAGTSVAAVAARKARRSVSWFAASLVCVIGLLLFSAAAWAALACLGVLAVCVPLLWLAAAALADPEGQSACDRFSWEPMISAATGAAVVGVLAMTFGRLFGAGSVSNTAGGYEAALLHYYLATGGLLAGVGVLGWLTRRNAIATLLSIFWIFEGASLMIVGSGRFRDESGGETLALWIVLAAVSEALVGAVFVVGMWRCRRELDVDALSGPDATSQTPQPASPLGRRPICGLVMALATLALIGILSW